MATVPRGKRANIINLYNYYVHILWKIHEIQSWIQKFPNVVVVGGGGASIYPPQQDFTVQKSAKLVCFLYSEMGLLMKTKGS